MKKTYEEILAENEILREQNQTLRIQIEIRDNEQRQIRAREAAEREKTLMKLYEEYDRENRERIRLEKEKTKIEERLEETNRRLTAIYGEIKRARDS